jgi:hypothetical protein
MCAHAGWSGGERGSGEQYVRVSLDGGAGQHDAHGGHLLGPEQALEAVHLSLAYLPRQGQDLTKHDKNMAWQGTAWHGMPRG